jgi:hypothetical protein
MRRGRELNGAGWAVAALAFAAIVALSGYVGLQVGLLVGLIGGAEAAKNTPTRPVGMAPDLSGVVNGAVVLGASALAALAACLLFGAALAWAACRLLLVPLLRSAQWSSRPARRGTPTAGAIGPPSA